MMILGVLGFILACVSLVWQVYSELVAEKQAIDLVPDTIILGKPSTPLGNLRAISPTKLYVNCMNTGNREIVLDYILVWHANAHVLVGRRYFRRYETGKHIMHSDSEGLKMDVEDLKCIEVDLVGEDGFFQPQENSRGKIEVVTSRGKAFKSKEFLFRDVADLSSRSIVER